MKISEEILYRISRVWPNPMKSFQKVLGADPSTDEYQINYGYMQYDSKTKGGVTHKIRGKKVVEIGCGHGGISMFIAVNGATEVVGIDLNTIHLRIAHILKQKIEQELNCAPLPVSFLEMNAYDMKLKEDHYDVVFADNVFEHFMEPQKVLEQSCKILKKGGVLVVPRFSSIWSKNALHLKNGLKVPWANLFFSEKTICNVMVRIVNETPWLEEIYPGYKDNPKKVRDLRRYKDLNDITFKKFKRMATEAGFEVESFHVLNSPVVVGKILNRIPFIKRTVLSDVFSIGASAVLKKK